MTFPLELYRNTGENEDDYIVRICSKKDYYGYTWQQVADFLNKQLGHNWNRRTYQNRYLHRYAPPYISPDEYSVSEKILKEIREEKFALQRERLRLSDERSIYNRAARAEAKREALVEEIVNAIEEAAVNVDSFSQVPYTPSETSMIAMITDTHAGLQIDNFVNSYSRDIMLRYFSKYAYDLFHHVLFLPHFGSLGVYHRRMNPACASGKAWVKYGALYVRAVPRVYTPVHICNSP